MTPPKTRNRPKNYISRARKKKQILSDSIYFFFPVSDIYFLFFQVPLFFELRFFSAAFARIRIFFAPMAKIIVSPIIGSHVHGRTTQGKFAHEKKILGKKKQIVDNREKKIIRKTAKTGINRPEFARKNRKKKILLLKHIEFYPNFNFQLKNEKQHRENPEKHSIYFFFLYRIYVSKFTNLEFLQHYLAFLRDFPAFSAFHRFSLSLSAFSRFFPHSFGLLTCLSTFSPFLGVFNQAFGR